ncbi:hypothetical protein DAI22_05g193450 [Oryza sativa Japonica Group]|nr:hypothetical protein DAI22_05g193450 [Oryza sativa Japonica Group]
MAERSSGDSPGDSSALTPLVGSPTTPPLILTTLNQQAPAPPLLHQSSEKDRSYKEVLLSQPPPAPQPKTKTSRSPTLHKEIPIANHCFRCLASDHLVRDCRDPIRCILCRWLGHRKPDCPTLPSMLPKTTAWFCCSPALAADLVHNPTAIHHSPNTSRSPPTVASPPATQPLQLPPAHVLQAGPRNLTTSDLLSAVATQLRSASGSVARSAVQGSSSGSSRISGLSPHSVQVLSETRPSSLAAHLVSSSVPTAVSSPVSMHSVKACFIAAGKTKMYPEIPESSHSASNRSGPLVPFVDIPMDRVSPAVTLPRSTPPQTSNNMPPPQPTRRSTNPSTPLNPPSRSPPPSHPVLTPHHTPPPPTNITPPEPLKPKHPHSRPATIFYWQRHCFE